MKISPIIILLVCILSTSCNKKVNTSIDFEKKVFDDIFLSAVDSTLVDLRIYMGFQYSEKQQDSIKKDTLHRVVAFDIQNYIAQDDFLTDSLRKYKLANDSVWNFKLEKYNTQRYDFKNSTEFPLTEQLTEWEKKYPKFSGNLSFSKIYFDDVKESGVFEATYYCGARCGLGYSVHIKKINNKWKITKVMHTWIS